MPIQLARLAAHAVRRGHPWVYREGIVQGRFGYSSAVSMVLFVIVLTITFVQFRLQKRSES